MTRPNDNWIEPESGFELPRKHMTRICWYCKGRYPDHTPHCPVPDWQHDYHDYVDEALETLRRSLQCDDNSAHDALDLVTRAIRAIQKTTAPNWLRVRCALAGVGFLLLVAFLLFLVWIS